MTANYKIEENKIRKIINKYIKPVDKDTEIQLRIFYKNRKLKNLLIKNKQREENSSNVVYQYNCNESGCNAAKYIGYTTNILKTRIQQHSYKGSIKDHLIIEHNKEANQQYIINNTTILARKSNKNELQILEALLIKQHNPIINVQSSNFFNVLKLF